MTDEKILIVEDESVVALNLQMRLELAYYQVAGVADSHQSALALLKDTCSDLVLLDIRLKNNQSGAGQCVDLHKGQITIQSEVNQGTIVVVKLPIMVS
ncbi:response regulator [Nostoc sp. HG1]|nr:response regulator [Nostoc sp. HG1]